MKKTMALVTVLYRSADVLEPFIQSLVKQTNKDWILYVVDNNEDNSDKDEFYKLSSKYDFTNFEFISNYHNFGISKGNNQGIEKSLNNEFEYTLLLNNDIYFDQDTFKLALEYSHENNVNILVPKIYYAGTNKIWMAGGSISKLKGTTSHRGDTQEDQKQFDKTETIEYAPTCFMLIKNEVFKEIGLMDERFFVYYDDTDFVFRLNKMGYKIIYFPEILIHHMVSFSTGGSESAFTIYQGNKNRIIFIRKNFGIIEKYFSLSFFMLTRIIKYFKYNSTQRQKMIEAIRDGFKVKLR